jgi:hypothetical protein
MPVFQRAKGYWFLSWCTYRFKIINSPSYDMTLKGRIPAATHNFIACHDPSPCIGASPTYLRRSMRIHNPVYMLDWLMMMVLSSAKGGTGLASEMWNHHVQDQAKSSFTRLSKTPSHGRQLEWTTSSVSYKRRRISEITLPLSLKILAWN